MTNNFIDITLTILVINLIFMLKIQILMINLLNLLNSLIMQVFGYIVHLTFLSMVVPICSNE